MNLLVATESGVWLSMSGHSRTELEGRRVSWLERHGTDLWAIVDQTRLWQRREHGEWLPAAESAGPALRCLMPLENSVLVGSARAHLYGYRGAGLERIESFERAPGREDWYTPWSGPPDIRSMAVDGKGSLYINVHVGGILRSEDAGTTWQPTIDADEDVHEVLVIPEYPGCLVAATANGLAVSRDSGATWSLDRAGLHADYCRAVARCGEFLLLSASDGPRPDSAALYRRRLDGEGFEHCQLGLPRWFQDNIDTGCVAGSGSAAAFGTRDGRVFISADAGASWSLALDGLPPVYRLLLA